MHYQLERKTTLTERHNSLRAAIVKQTIEIFNQMHFIMQAVYVIVFANIIPQVTLMSSNFRMGLFDRISVLSNFVVKDSSLWIFNNVLSATHCTGHCVEDIDCNSVFYNNVTGVCIGHSTVYTTPKTATAAPGSIYFSKNKPEGK